MKEIKNFFLSFHFLMILFFICPYLILIKFFNISWNLNFSEIIWPIRNSLEQSLMASICILIISFFMSLALLAIKESTYKIICRLLLVPQMLPSLFSIIIALSIWKPFPMGTVGIVFVFILVNLGYSAVFLSSRAKGKLGNSALVSEVFGLGRIRFIKDIYLPMVYKDLIFNFFMIFIFCLSSFSIPLAVGAGRGTNLEVFIYEKIFIDQNYSLAVFLSSVQSFIVTLISYFILKSKNSDVISFSRGSYLKSLLGVILIVIYLMVYFGGYLSGVLNSLKSFSAFHNHMSDILLATAQTTQLMLFYILFSFALLLAWIFNFIKNKKMNLAVNIIANSTVLVSFSFYLFFPTDKSFDAIKLSLALVILFFPSLFKSFLQEPIENLSGQIKVAEIFGLSRIRIILSIILRQLKPFLILWFSFLSIFFLCDFAASKALGLQTLTLGLITFDFLSSYRLSFAYLISFYMLMVWLIMIVGFYFLIGVLSVIDKKFISAAR